MRKRFSVSGLFWIDFAKVTFLTLGYSAALRCTPLTALNITNGLCVHRSKLIDFCQDRRFSRSNDCAAEHFCCFDEGELAIFKLVTAEDGCSPVTAPEISDGKCVQINQLKQQCSAMEIASSVGCKSSGGLCCFKRPAGSKVTPVFGE